MDEQFVWREEYEIGVESIDREHQRLFKIINKVFSFKDQDKDSHWACQEGLKYFKTHALKHFSEEEAYMASIEYPGLKEHQHVHQVFRDITLPALERELAKTDYASDAVDHFLGVCAGWLIGHTLTEDQDITGKRTVRKWEKLLPREELKVMQKVIIQLVFDMFHLESHLISDAYSGEKFGKGIYYRLVFGSGQSAEKSEVILAFEEKLLINTVGRVMGIQTNKLDSMLIHATRYTARQFVERVMESLPNLGGHELKEENILSYEQLQKIFQRETMQASLLFDTGAGYFAYCFIAPHLLEEGVGTPIQGQNALEEVEKYLQRREAQSDKRKILVVDDSMTIREGMKRLLAEDYEVAVVDSGVAAIRTMTLNRPDLVLLDYEMPVCDGRQTLEMLRGVKEFDEIPVIFLTGRSDPDSVRRVMALKPAGYLLKDLKPAETKKKIDAFFSVLDA